MGQLPQQYQYLSNMPWWRVRFNYMMWSDLDMYICTCPQPRRVVHSNSHPPSSLPTTHAPLTHAVKNFTRTHEYKFSKCMFCVWYFTRRKWSQRTFGAVRQMKSMHYARPPTRRLWDDNDDGILFFTNKISGIKAVAFRCGEYTWTRRGAVHWAFRAFRTESTV